MEKKTGHYLGTEIDEKWWKRYRKDRFFARGNGEYWHDEQGFYFLRYLTKEPLFIPFESILEIKSGKWHSGRWSAGVEILKIIWNKEGWRLSSGFRVSVKKEETDRLKEILKEKIKSQEKRREDT